MKNIITITTATIITLLIMAGAAMADEQQEAILRAGATTYFNDAALLQTKNHIDDNPALVNIYCGSLAKEISAAFGDVSGSVEQVLGIGVKRNLSYATVCNTLHAMEPQMTADDVRKYMFLTIDDFIITHVPPETPDFVAAYSKAELAALMIANSETISAVSYLKSIANPTFRAATPRSQKLLKALFTGDVAAGLQVVRSVSDAELDSFSYWFKGFKY